ncbi:hypothetical protein [Curtobacterium sp. MCBD17_003]|uniref:hypothetical protein n=1 Tax=Curtobacterium sp. MCBD17_003 TaxID=2175667 RepID=UPI000DA8E1A3|nr:hypothetical protein [Curtobacterium sp. MCBD17_003]WIE54237.1 hypothetical protein DEI88_014100 [Curtobacterium sp. MCBD17_003]
MELTLKKFAPSILSLFTLILGVFTAAGDAANLLTLVTVLQIVVVLATTGTAYWLPLVLTKWQGIAKTGAEIVGVVATIVLPYALAGHITRAQVIIVLTAIVKSIATEIGVQIRTAPIDAGSTASGTVPVITSVSVGSALVSGDGLTASTTPADASTTVDPNGLTAFHPDQTDTDAPKHAA